MLYKMEDKLPVTMLIYLFSIGNAPLILVIAVPLSIYHLEVQAMCTDLKRLIFQPSALQGLIKNIDLL